MLLVASIIIVVLKIMYKFYIMYNLSRSTMAPGIDSASNINEYQGM